MPTWLKQSPPAQQAFVLAHETSHIEAYDPQLLTAALALVVLMPWNVPLWWQLKRLRKAVEIDCDARVLRAGHDATRYGETLLAIGLEAVENHRHRDRNVRVPLISGREDRNHDQ